MYAYLLGIDGYFIFGTIVDVELVQGEWDPRWKAGRLSPIFTKQGHQPDVVPLVRWLAVEPSAVPGSVLNAKKHQRSNFLHV